MSLSSLPPGTEPATTVVTCNVLVDGAALSGEIALLKLSVNKTYNKIAFAKLIFADGSVADRDFELSNDNKFKPGKTIEVRLGFDGDADTVFKGIIVKHGIKIRQSGHPLLLIEAKHKAVKLTGARHHKYYINKKDSEIIESLTTALTGNEVQSTTVTHPQMVQYDCTDWDFMLTRAEANGMLVFTDGDGLVIKKPAVTGAPVVTATFGDNILEFEAEMDARRQIQAVTGNAWDYTQQTVRTSGSGMAAFAEPGNLPSDEVAGVMAATVQLNHSGVLKAPELQGWADAYALRSQISKATGRVRLHGNAAVKPGAVMRLAGVGDRFNGNVLVTGVLHHYEGYWHTDVQFGWQDDWFYKKEDVMDKPASGLLPGINGLQIGLVLDVNDTEAGGQYRVKVHVPMITGSSDGMWARVATLDAGAERGVYFRPQVNDEVILGFLNDDPREPIILGYLHSKDAHQSPFADTSDSSQVFGIVTQQKLKIEFDDTNKKMTLFVPVSGENGKKVVLNDSGAMELKDEYNNSIKMDTAGITIQAGAGKNVTIKGTQVLIN